MRFSPEEAAEVERLAGQRMMDFSEYVRAAALGRLDAAGQDLEEADWRARIDARVRRLERLAYDIDD